jgi:hypothetical protein
MSFSISKHDILNVNSNELGLKLQDLAGIVFRKHFYASLNEKVDLMSVGVLKALSLIDSGNWKEDKGSVLNYLYTGMRNEMHNYIYHQNKDIKTDEVLRGITTDSYFDELGLIINISVIDEVCKFFNSVYGNISGGIARELEGRGFRVVGLNRDKNKENTCLNEDFLDRICGAVIWKNREYFL